MSVEEEREKVIVSNGQYKRLDQRLVHSHLFLHQSRQSGLQSRKTDSCKVFPDNICMEVTLAALVIYFHETYKSET